MEEAKKRDPSSIFEALITSLESQFDTITKKYDTEKDKLIESLMVKYADSRNDLIDLGSGADRFPTPNGDLEEGETREVVRNKQVEIDKIVAKEVESARKTEYEATRKCLALVWVVYMRVMRRLQVCSCCLMLFLLPLFLVHFCALHVVNWLSAGFHRAFVVPEVFSLEAEKCPIPHINYLLLQVCNYIVSKFSSFLEAGKG